MMLLILLTLIQCVCLCAGQVFLKIAMANAAQPTWSWHYVVHDFLLNGWWFGCGISFLAAGALWVYILKNYPFSIAYPLTSLTYIFGMLAAIFVFREQVDWMQWVGILLIVGGCYLIAR